MIPNYIFPPIQQPMMQQPQSQYNGLNWVQGEAGAKAWIVAAGNTVDLWDSENPVIYLKSADASGMPSMKILDYTIRGGTPTNPITAPQSDFVTKDELHSLEEKVEALSGKLEAATKRSTARRGDADDK